MDNNILINNMFNIKFRFRNKSSTQCFDRQTEISKLNYEISKYINDYYDKHNKVLYINHDVDKQRVLKCPTCRKAIDLNKRIKRIYVQTECICCLKHVSKTVLFSCSHANVCTQCFLRIRDEHLKVYHPYFINENGSPVKISNKQHKMYLKKKELLLDW